MHDDDDLDPAIRRRRKLREQAKRRRLVALGVSGAALAVVLLVVVVKAIGPSASAEGDKWTHRELVDHLTKNGVPVRLIGAGNSGAAYMVTKDVTKEDEWMAIQEAERSGPPAGVIRFSRAETADAARRAVGGLPPDTPAYNWGPWVFTGDRSLLDRIRGVLR